MGTYYEPDYIEEDYFEEETMAVTPLPSPPSRGDLPAVFVEKGDAFLGSLPKFALELEALALAMNNNSTSSTSATSHTIASSGSKTFIVNTGKSYLPGQAVKAASTVDGTVWMQGDVTSYSSTTGELVIVMNASQGAGTIANWTLTLTTSVANPTGSLANDFSVRSLTHAIGANIASAATIDLSTATGQLVHITGAATITAVGMTPGKDIWAIFDGAVPLTYHVTNLHLNSGGANITTAAGGRALFSSDGTTVWVTYFKPDGKANAETAAPAGPPVGSCLIHFASTPPANYLVCPTVQTNLNRTTYSTLFNAIGIAWGAGDGSTTFGMPWFPPGYTMIQANGNVGASDAGQVKSHTHTIAVWESETGNAGVTQGGPTAAGSYETSPTGGAANYAAGSRVLICVKYQ